jgi:lysophospholipase L1-like esterase
VYRAFEISRPIINSARAFTKEGSKPGILVAGDSTGFGIGASKPEESVAGRLSVDMPNLALENISKNGLRTAGLLEHLKALPEEKKYSLVLLQIGGNDIVNLTSRDTFINSLRLVFVEAKKRGNRVVLMSTGDVGNSPVFGPVLSALFSWRSKEFRKNFIEESKNAGVTYVDLYEPRETDPFVQDPFVYHAGDGFHPSSDGYGVWYGKLKTVLK